ncbi:MAG: NUDIX domain-containing protein [Candidatus Paceibacterota bacterium]
MTKICDHKSVGMIVKNGDKILLIERGREPYGFAIPAGHVDGDSSFEDAAIRELNEEVGLDAKNLKLIIEGRKENKCRREDGSWHLWKIYEIQTTGELNRSQDETKQAGWYDQKQIKALAEKTEEYLKGKISEDEWQKSPGLEVVMYEWFKELNII